MRYPAVMLAMLAGPVAAGPFHPVATPVHAPAALSPADDAAIRALIRTVYGRYRHNAEMPPAEPRIFAPSTLAIAAENRRLLQGEEGDIGADPFLDAQDHGTVTVDRVALAPRPDGRVSATVVFSDREMRVRAKTKAMVVERMPAGWRVYDLKLPEQGWYRAVMLDENRRLKAERR